MTTPNDELRPISFDDYIGQPKLKETLRIKINSALIREEPLDHMLFSGPPGSGKTSLANVIARQMDVNYFTQIMPMKKGLLPKLVSNFSGIVFFDEIHRCSVKEQEELLPLIEDGYLQLGSGRTIEANNLTILAATTEKDKIIPPLYQRFFTPSFEEYSLEELQMIAYGMGLKIGVSLDSDMSLVFAKASSGTPRNLKSMVYMYRDLTYLYDHITPEQVLDACRVTADGLTEDHILYLKTLKKLGGLAGIDLIASQMQLNKASVSLLEQHLIKQEFIAPTKSGRELLNKGYKKAGETNDFI